MVDDLVAARAALANRDGRPARPVAALWQWDLARGRVEWDGPLLRLLGYADRVTDPAWREVRIHPADRKRVKLSLSRATIVNHGAVWSEQYRFRRADGGYVHVTESAYVVSDDEGPRVVVGAITPLRGEQE